MRETKRHGDAFDYYYSLGEGRSYPEVASKFTVSRTSVKKWSKAFNWRKRVADRDIEISRKLQAKTDREIVNSKADYRKMVKGWLKDLVETDELIDLLIAKAKENEELEIMSIKDLTEALRAQQGNTAKKVELIKTDLVLMGEADSIAEEKIIIVNDLTGAGDED